MAHGKRCFALSQRIVAAFFSALELLKQWVKGRLHAFSGQNLKSGTTASMWMRGYTRCAQMLGRRITSWR